MKILCVIKHLVTGNGLVGFYFLVDCFYYMTSLKKEIFKNPLNKNITQLKNDKNTLGCAVV